MDSTYQKALEGTLRSTKTGTRKTKLTFVNKLPITIRPAFINTQGLLEFGQDMPTKSTAEYSDSYAGYAYVFVTADSGAFVCAYVQGADDGKDINELIDPAWLCTPNDIGQIPEPNKAKPIPLDSQGVLVGVGDKLVKGVYISIARYQFWRLTQESICLAAGESRIVSFQETNGMQQTSSDESTMSAAIGFQSRVGWGPISASLSASLSKTSTTMQQVVITKETVSYNEVKTENPTKETRMFLRWQLTDVITVFKNLEPVASLVSGSIPSIVSKPYDPAKLPDPPASKADPRVVAPAFKLLAAPAVREPRPTRKRAPTVVVKGRRR